MTRSEPPPLTAEQEAFALDYDPWGERDATYRVLSNAFVTTRKPCQCAICFEAVPIGSRVRASREVDDGKAATFRFCPQCCWLMAHRLDDDRFEELCGRYDVGRKNAEESRRSV